ncbi:MAG TPA: ferric reductase-like transmembrane domain-containing protein [Acidimicrobiia bacterium]|nr:ferric reductase-like transmembrane domain-containing protein [Acidimicrobiia bacterium]
MIAATSAGTASASKALWYLTRGTGVVSLVLLTLSLVLGIVTAVRWEHRQWPRWIIEGLHRNVSLLVVAFIGVHVATTVVDGFAPIGWLDAVVPFRSPYRPVWLGLGALSFDMLLALALTSIVRARLGHRLWRAVHWLAYACWPVALVHGLGTGSDARQTWMLGLVVVSVAAVLASVAWRVALAWPHRAPAEGWAAVAGAVLVTAAVAAWAALGPLQPGWAKAAGTPAALTATVSAAGAPPALPAAGAPTSGGAAGATGGGLSPFAATLDGTVTQSAAVDGGDDGGGGSVVVELSGTLRGGPFSSFSLRLLGRPLASGGVALQSSAVALGPASDPTAWQGGIRTLDGGRVAATVTDTSGRSMDLTLDLTVDHAAGTVHGTLSAVPSAVPTAAPGARPSGAAAPRSPG